MSSPRMHDLYPNSPAYRELQPLRIPAGWTIGWNELRAGMEAEAGEAGASSVFNATNPARRFNIDVAFTPEGDPEGGFHLTVLYQPWPRSAQGRRLKDAAFALSADAEVAHAFETGSGAALVAELEHWIARCTVWEREGS